MDCADPTMPRPSKNPELRNSVYPSIHHVENPYKTYSIFLYSGLLKALGDEALVKSGKVLRHGFNIAVEDHRNPP